MGWVVDDRQPRAGRVRVLPAVNAHLAAPHPTGSDIADRVDRLVAGEVRAGTAEASLVNHCRGGLAVLDRRGPVLGVLDRSDPPDPEQENAEAQCAPGIRLHGANHVGTETLI